MRLCFFKFAIFSLLLRTAAFSAPEPQRVISLAPVITESIYAIGAEKKLVGVTRFCDRPVLAQKIKKIGGYIDPQLEAILSLHPDLVIGMELPSHQQILTQLRKLKIATEVVQGQTIADIRKAILQIGKSLHREKAAQLSLQQFDKKLASFKNQLRCSLNTLVLPVISGSPFIVAGPHTFIGEALKLIGVRSAVPPTATSWPMWSAEAILQNPPRAILLTEGEDALKAMQYQLAPILNLASLKNTQLIAPAKRILQRPGPYLIDDIKQLIWLLTKYGICHINSTSNHVKKI